MRVLDEDGTRVVHIYLAWILKLFDGNGFASMDCWNEKRHESDCHEQALRREVPATEQGRKRRVCGAHSS